MKKITIVTLLLVFCFSYTQCMETVPNEVLRMILGEMSYKQRKGVSRVSKMWSFLGHSLLNENLIKELKDLEETIEKQIQSFDNKIVSLESLESIVSKIILDKDVVSLETILKSSPIASSEKNKALKNKKSVKEAIEIVSNNDYSNKVKIEKLEKLEKLEINSNSTSITKYNFLLMASAKTNQPGLFKALLDFGMVEKDAFSNFVLPLNHCFCNAVKNKTKEEKQNSYEELKKNWNFHTNWKEVEEAAKRLHDVV